MADDEVDVATEDEPIVITESAKINCRDTVVDRAAMGVTTPDESPMLLFGTDVTITGGDFSMAFDKECCDASSEIFCSCNEIPELSSLSNVLSNSFSCVDRLLDDDCEDFRFFDVDDAFDVVDAFDDEAVVDVFDGMLQRLRGAGLLFRSGEFLNCSAYSARML